MKYIIVRVVSDGSEHAILFPVRINHRQVARIHRADQVVVVSAGFVKITRGTTGQEIQVYGESETLGMASRPGDAEIIEESLK